MVLSMVVAELSKAAAPLEWVLRVLAPFEGRMQAIAPPEWVFRVLDPLEGQLQAGASPQWVFPRRQWCILPPSGSVS